MKEGGQGMEVIEKTRREGDKIVGVEPSKNKNEERDELNEESLKINKFRKTRKDIRWKRGEIVTVEKVRKQSESEDG
jgi:hypothetical protein